MSAFGERPGQESQIAYVRRRKSGLETPLRGRFIRERYLYFSPPLWYDVLVGSCILGGAFYVLLNLRGGAGFWAAVSAAVMFAGIWGLASNERMICDFRHRTYVRFEGGGLLKRVLRGSLSELDALVLTSEQPVVGGLIHPRVIYRLVLYWKGMRHPPLIAEREDRTIGYGAPLNSAAQRILQRGGAYAKALAVPYYDNSHLHGRSPLPAI